MFKSLYQNCNWVKKPWTKPTGRLVLGVVVTLLISSVWFLGAWWNLPWPDAWRWIATDLPFSVVHLTFFPVAVGLFCATCSWTRITNFRPGGKWTAFLLLICLGGIAIWLTVKDFTGGSVGPHELRKDQGQLRALSLERRLRDFAATRERQDAANDGFKRFNIRLFFEDLKIENLKKEYKELIINQDTQGGFCSKWNRINGVGYIDFFLDLLFGVFDAVFFWWLIVAVLAVIPGESERDRRRLYHQLLLGYSLLIGWFVPRLVASENENFFWHPDWLQHYPALWVLTLTAGGTLFLVLSVTDGGSIQRIYAAYIGVVSVVAGVAAKFWGTSFTGLCRQIDSVVQEGGPIFLIAIDVLLLIVPSVLAWTLVTPFPVSTPPPATPDPL